MKTLPKIDAMISFIIGLMSVFSGSLVLLKINIPDYEVLNWLVIYNIILGGFSIFTAFLIWRISKFSKIFIISILILHSLVLAYLYFISETAAIESVKAMIFRVSIWIIIWGLAYRNLDKPNSTINE